MNQLILVYDKLKKYSYFLYFVPAISILVFSANYANGFVLYKEHFFKLTLLAILLVGCSKFYNNVVVGEKIKLLLPKQFSKLSVSNLLVAGLFVSMLVTIFSSHPEMSLYGTYERGLGLFTYICLALYILILVNCCSRSQLKNFLKAVYALGLFISLYAIGQRFGFDPFFINFDIAIFVGRSFAFLGNPGVLGQFLTLIFLLGIAIFRKSINWHWWSAQVFLLMGIIVTESRAAILALVLSLTLLACKEFRSVGFSFIKRYLGKLILILVVISVFTLPLINLERFGLGEVATRSLSSRWEIWHVAKDLIVEQPLGHGLGVFSLYFPNKVDKDFFTVEQDLNTFADRIHNEFLEVIFATGLFGGIFYLMLIGLVFHRFWRSTDSYTAGLLLVLIANFIQNLFSFSDFSILLLLALVLASYFREQAAAELEKINLKFSLKPLIAAFLVFLTIVIIALAYYRMAYLPLLANRYYTYSKVVANSNYDLSVELLKQATAIFPYYSHFWYELIYLDVTSLPRAIHYLSQIEGATGNVLAWRANWYSVHEPQEAYAIFEQLLAINPYNPHWLRAYADALYRKENYTEALRFYRLYLEAVPDYWKWRENLANMTYEDQERYRIFFKNVSDFWTIPERVKFLEQSQLDGSTSKQADINLN